MNGSDDDSPKHTMDMLRIVSTLGPRVMATMASIDQPHGASTLGGFAMIIGLSIRVNAKPGSRDEVLEGVFDQIRKIALNRDLSLAVYRAMFGMESPVPPELD